MRAAVFLAVSLAGTAASADTVERQAAADPRGEVEIVNVAGYVQVRGWDRAEVQVTADIGSGQELAFSSEGKRTIVKVEVPGRLSSGSTDLTVRVPRDSSLSINTVSADQRIEDVRGAQRLQAVSGSIVTSVWGKDFEARTVSGDVSVQGHGAPAPARVTTVSGNVRLEGLGREIELNTVTGDMQVRVAELARARIKTTNGNLNLSTKLIADGRIDAEAINGDLRFALKAPLDAEFDIETFNGDIESCFGPQPRRSREYGPGNELRFKEGQGSGRVRIKTLNGEVRLCDK
jgi:DUF4097 and DUF4098 domain-containing protein YvlB